MSAMNAQVLFKNFFFSRKIELMICIVLYGTNII